MNTPIKNAFTYMFKDVDWRYKLSIFVMLSIPSAFFSLERLYAPSFPDMVKTSIFYPLVLLFVSIAMIIVALFANGYFCKAVRQISNADLNNEKELLPAWENDFFNFAKVGFFLFIAQIIAALVLIIPFLLIVPAILFLVLKPALMKVFCSEFDITSFLAWRKAYALVKENSSSYIKIILTGLAIFMVYTIIAYGLELTFKPLLLIILPFLSAYTQLVYAYLYGIIGKDKVIETEVLEIIEQ